MPDLNSSAIKHVFVLMLENHSFDNILGFSGITGTDAVTHAPTAINGLTGTETNTYNGKTYTASQPADFSMPVDPSHEFPDTLLQLSGESLPYDVNMGYPAITNGGFVNDYAKTLQAAKTEAAISLGDIMNGFSPEQLPVINALAREYALCDNWFSSFPGPTWPNRYFLHAASSGGLDHSPTNKEILRTETIAGMDFENGTIFDQLRKFDDGYRIYRGDSFLSDFFCNVGTLKGIHSYDLHPIGKFIYDINGHYPYKYTFIEPSFGDSLNNTYKGGTSQHPLDDARGGERLLKETYEAIRNSPLWESSLFIVAWDEHGGFYDHVVPPAAIAPGDKTLHAEMNQYGFDFKQYGIRVPGIIISPYVAKNTIDHRLYDHTSILKTIEEIFGLNAMTERDKHANSLLPLLNLSQPRTDTPKHLPEPADSYVPVPPDAAHNMAHTSADKGNLPGFLHAALRSDLASSPIEEHHAIKKEFSNITTQADARAYMSKVADKTMA